jgi:hypothetical protein
LPANKGARKKFGLKSRVTNSGALPGGEILSLIEN